MTFIFYCMNKLLETIYYFQNTFEILIDVFVVD